MALSNTVPWIAPPTIFGEAMRAGASMGLSLRRQDEEEKQVADRLRLAYDSLASKERLAAQDAKQQLDLKHQSLAESARQHDMLMKFHLGQLEEQKRQHDLMAGRPVSPLGKLQSDRESALKSGDPEKVKQYDLAIGEALSKKGMAVMMGLDDQHNPIMQMVSGGAEPIRPPTVAVQSQAQSDLLQYENAMGLINYLQKNLKPEHVGLRGAAGEMIADKTLAQFVPGVASGERIKARDTMGWLREAMLRKISDDKSGRYTKADREEIERLMPSTGVFESAERAQTALQRAREILSDRARVYSTRLNQKPPLWALSPDEIRKLAHAGARSGLSPASPQFKENFITDQEAIDALVRYH
jgi:hypothetical protein